MLEKVIGEIDVNRETAPEFLRLFEESVLRALLEQGILDDIQYQICVDRILQI